MPNKALVLFLLALAAAAGCSDPQPPDAAAPVHSLALAVDAYLEALIDAYEIPGLAVSIVRDSEVVYTRAFGVENVESGEPLSVHHLFHFASVSKTFVATAIMQLVEGGVLDLDAQLTTYLPYFRLADLRYRDITIRQLLNHTSGMPDEDDYEWDRPQTDEGASERYVRSLASERLIGPPGGHWAYSNIAYDVLADLIAKVSEQSFESYMDEHVLDPLGMRESTFLYPSTREGLRVSGHLMRLRPTPSDVYPYNRRHAASSTLNSNVVEMAQWMLVHLGRGTLGEVSILSEDTHAAMWTPSAEISLTSEMGLGWFLTDHEGMRVVYHGGGDTGFRSFLELLPARHSGFVLASNYEGLPRDRLTSNLREILLGADSKPVREPIGVAFRRIYFQEGIDAAKSFYRQALTDRQDGYELSDGQIRLLGIVLFEEHTQDAIEVFRLNAELHRDVASSHETLAEAYLKTGQKELAIKSYQKALELEPAHERVRQALKGLGARPKN